jgi:hypothetical protein
MSDLMAADTLSDVLRTVRLTGALFFMMDVSSPWEAELPDGATLASSALPGAQHVISYHVVTAGACWGGLVDETPVRLEAGDVLVLPRGDAYFISTAPGMRRRQDLTAELAFLRDMAAGRLPFVVKDGSGGPEGVHLVCGFLGCDLRPFNPLLATLPRLLHVRGVCGSAGDRASQLIELALEKSRERRAGGECIRLRLSELMSSRSCAGISRRLLPSRRAGSRACEIRPSRGRSRSCTSGRITRGRSKSWPARSGCRARPWPTASRRSTDAVPHAVADAGGGASAGGWRREGGGRRARRRLRLGPSQPRRPAIRLAAATQPASKLCPASSRSMTSGA